MNGHLSCLHVTVQFHARYPNADRAGPLAFLFALAPDGACQAAVLPRRWWSLTPPFQLFPLRLAAQVGVFFSAALSVGSLRPAVSRHPALSEPGLSSRVLQAAHRATVWPTQQSKSVTHRCRRQWHNANARHDKPRTAMRYNGPVDGQRRQSRRDRAPHPSVLLGVFRPPPRGGMSAFFMH